MGVNEVKFGNNTIMSTRDTTVTPDTLLMGSSALDANGEVIDGEFVPCEIGYYREIRKRNDFLYDVYYDGIDYDYALDYFKNSDSGYGYSGCTSITKGNLFGRNLDWKYDNEVEFVVHTPHRTGRFASIGVAGAITGLTKDVVSSGEYNELYKLVPFKMLDGINEKGVCVSVNVVPNKGNSTINPSADTEMCVSMLVRYILDHYEGAENACYDIQNNVKIFFPSGMQSSGYELHFHVADKNGSYEMEFIDDQVVIIDEVLCATNFHLNGVTFNEDGKVYTPYTQHGNDNAYDTNHVELNGTGLERYNFAISGIGLVQNIWHMKTLLQTLYYTSLYTVQAQSSIWYTELVDGTNLTVKTPYSSFSSALTNARDAYAQRSRETGLTWHTTHSVAYDMDTLFMVVTSQENSETWYEYSIGVDSINVIDNLDSYSSTDALSANQGRVLKELVDSKADTSVATTTTNGLMSDADKVKLDGISSGAEVNVQSDWNQTNTSADDYIKNKPTIPSPTIVVDNVTSTSTTSALSANQGRLLSAGIGSVASDLASKGVSGLADTSITNPTDGQGLIWSTSQNKWVNRNVSGGITVVDNLTSTSTTDALSANQGRVLNTTKKTVHDTTLEYYAETLEDADNGDLIIIQDSDGALGVNVVNTLKADLDDTIAEVQEGDIVIVDDEDDEGTIDDTLEEIITDIGDMSDLPTPTGTIVDNIVDINTNLSAVLDAISNIKIKRYVHPARTYTKGSYVISWAELGLNFNEINVHTITGIIGGYTIPRPAIDNNGNYSAEWAISVKSDINGVIITCGGSWNNTTTDLLVFYSDK